MTKRQQRKRESAKRLRLRAGEGRPVVADAYGGWQVAGDGRSVVGVCNCGEPAIADCAVCGPQCQVCFLLGAETEEGVHAPGGL